jgi:DnaK suppressor protein
VADSKTTEIDLDDLKEQLLEQQARLTDQYEHDVQAGKDAADERADDIVDRANNSYNRELMFSLSDAERESLILVEGALKRLEEGTFGTCVNCGRAIGAPRLEAVPWARYCIACQELAEQGMLEDEGGS